VLHVCLDFRISKSTADKTLRVKDGVVRVHSDLIFGRVPNETFAVGESNVGWRRSVTLIVGNDFDPVILPYSDAAICRSKIDTDSLS